MTHAELLAAIKVYCDSGVEFSPEGLADHLWGNEQQLRILKRAAREKVQQELSKKNGYEAELSKGLEPYEILSPRQLQVLALLAEGKCYQEIADALGLSYHTAHRHIGEVRRRLGLRKATELTRWYMEHV